MLLAHAVRFLQWAVCNSPISEYQLINISTKRLIISSTLHSSATSIQMTAPRPILRYFTPFHFPKWHFGLSPTILTTLRETIADFYRLLSISRWYNINAISNGRKMISATIKWLTRASPHPDHSSDALSWLTITALYVEASQPTQWIQPLSHLLWHRTMCLPCVLSDSRWRIHSDDGATFLHLKMHCFTLDRRCMQNGTTSPTSESNSIRMLARTSAIQPSASIFRIPCPIICRYI